MQLVLVLVLLLLVLYLLPTVKEGFSRFASMNRSLGCRYDYCSSWCPEDLYRVHRLHEHEMDTVGCDSLIEKVIRNHPETY